MKKNNLSIAVLVIVALLSGYFFIAQKDLEKKIANLITREEISLRKLRITNKFGDTIIELSENDHFSGSIALYNKSQIHTIYINGGNEDQHPGILMLKAKDEVSFALMVQDKQNLVNIYNKDGLDVVSLGTDEYGHGGYSIKNAQGKVIKTEGWGWRAYKY